MLDVSQPCSALVRRLTPGIRFSLADFLRSLASAHFKPQLAGWTQHLIQRFEGVSRPDLPPHSGSSRFTLRKVIVLVLNTTNRLHTPVFRVYLAPRLVQPSSSCPCFR